MRAYGGLRGASGGLGGPFLEPTEGADIPLAGRQGSEGFPGRPFGLVTTGTGDLDGHGREDFNVVRARRARQSVHASDTHVPCG